MANYIKIMAITQQYQKYLNGPEWQKKRILIFIRDGYLCQKCKKENATQVHHKSYANIFKEPLSDLMSVCGSCHRLIHGIKTEEVKKKKSIFGRVLAKVIR